MNWRKQVLLAIAAGAIAPTAVWAQVGVQQDWNNPPFPQSVQINIAGATLVRPLFENRPGLTNDFIDVDGDGISGFNAAGPTFVDQMATDISSFNAAGQPTFNKTTAFSNNVHWVTNYRGVGSVNGFNEFLQYQQFGTVPTSIPGEKGYINRVEYASGGTTTTGGGKIPAGASRGPTGVPIGLNIASVDVAVLDVPSKWATRVDGANKWNRKPTQAGYGHGAPASNTGFSLPLPSIGTLNTNTSSPDGNTIYDQDIAFVPVAILANRGVGLDDNNDGAVDGNIRAKRLQHLYVTGRTETGENLVAAGRSAGSGTRNAIMNSLNIDPAWGNGDNVGSEFVVTQVARLGTGDVGQTSDGTFQSNVKFQPNHAEASSGAEFAARNHRLAVSYTGIAGRADDWDAGRWEVANVRKDFDGDGDSIQDNTSTTASAYVRPTIPNVVDANASNADFAYKEKAGGSTSTLSQAVQLARNPDGQMYEFGGPAAWVTRGDPESGRNGNTNPAMSNLAARDFLRNLKDATAAFSVDPAATTNTFTPGQTLGQLFLLPEGQDRKQSKDDPTVFTGTSPTNATLQKEILANLNWDVGAGVSIGEYGTSTTGSVAGLVPERKGSVAGVLYTDGTLTKTSATNAATYNSGNSYQTIDGTTLTYGTPLNARNEIAYDFNQDDRRNLDDVQNMMKWAAIRGLGGFTGTAPGAPESGTGLSLEIVADGNGDGNFDAEDIRYFADGLAMTVGAVRATPDAPETRKLDRKAGFVSVDQQWQAITGQTNFFGVTKSTWANAASNFYNAGDARGDIAGSVTGAIAGASPTGADGIIDATDVQYVYDQFMDLADKSMDWINLDEAAFGDLSADMNGDLKVDILDIIELVGTQLSTIVSEDSPYPNETLTGILHAQPGDFNLDGVVDVNDLNIWNANAFTSGAKTFMQGDADFDFDVDADDIAGINSNFFQQTHSPEPGTATLLALSGLGLLRRRRA